ncbi:MAG: histidine phosphatase family protein [Patescibacteria group bacterium]
MKTLIIVRHGDYYGPHLSDCGRNQMKALGEKLQAIINGSSVLLFTSIAGRAKESAEVLGTVLGIGFEEHEILWSECDHREDLPGTLKLVRSRKDEADVLILVTHYEYVDEFPSYFAIQELGVQLRSKLIGKGEACVLDCQQKTLEHVC